MLATLKADHEKKLATLKAEHDKNLEKKIKKKTLWARTDFAKNLRT